MHTRSKILCKIFTLFSDTRTKIHTYIPSHTWVLNKLLILKKYTLHHKVLGDGNILTWLLDKHTGCPKKNATLGFCAVFA